MCNSQPFVAATKSKMCTIQYEVYISNISKHWFLPWPKKYKPMNLMCPTHSTDLMLLQVVDFSAEKRLKRKCVYADVYIDSTQTVIYSSCIPQIYTQTTSFYFISFSIHTHTHSSGRASGKKITTKLIMWTLVQQKENTTPVGDPNLLKATKIEQKYCFFPWADIRFTFVKSEWKQDRKSKMPDDLLFRGKNLCWSNFSRFTWPMVMH